MVAIEDARSSVRAVVAEHPCPSWLQGIATANRLRNTSSGHEESDPQVVFATMQQLCMHGKVAQRLAAARMLSRVSRYADVSVLDFLRGNNISSEGFGELS